MGGGVGEGEGLEMERHITANLAEVKIFPQITFNDHKQEHRESVGDCCNRFFLSFYDVT